MCVRAQRILSNGDAERVRCTSNKKAFRNEARVSLSQFLSPPGVSFCVCVSTSKCAKPGTACDRRYEFLAKAFYTKQAQSTATMTDTSTNPAGDMSSKSKNAVSLATPQTTENNAAVESK